MRRLAALIPAFTAAIVLSWWGVAAPAPQTGPATEKRFPPLDILHGFKATLFACDPLIEYPSVIAAGPKANQLFVAIDYMTGLGVDIVRRDEIRLIEDTDNDGYADKATVVAGGFNSIQGLAYHDGVIYVMHAPFLTALRDIDGKFDERRDLLSGLGLEPEKNPPRLHCANGVTVGHDGWLYLSLGDHGCNVLRPEGDRLIFNGGGILRCRFDGRDLHVFATGLRNIYDVALDEDLNVFTRDNENDGGDYMIRVCHSFFGADHGYPYLYYERPDEAMPPIADLGRGSSAGGVCYLETAFPEIFRGNLFFCEWGRSLVRYPLKRQAGGFAPTRELEFAAGSPKDPYGFKPTDVVVQRDGALMVSDWCDGQRPKRGRGRIYRIAAASAGKPQAKTQPGSAGLDSESYYERVDRQTELERRGREAAAEVHNALVKQTLGVRGRMHAVWILARTEGADAIPKLMQIFRNDPEPRVRVQAIRAVADLADPVLRDHRLDAGRGDPLLAVQLASADSFGSSVLLEKVIALGRLRWADAPGWFQRSGLASPLLHEHALVHAMQQTMRRADNWPEVLKLLDNLPDTYTLRTIALRALADQPDVTVVDGLITRLAKEKDASLRREYADLLTRVCKKPGPWVYWNYRPAPRPANNVAWERTEAIEQALDNMLADPDRDVRLAVLKRMQRERIPISVAALGRWLDEDTDEKRVAAIFAEFRLRSAAEPGIVDAVSKIVPDKKHALAARREALNMLIGRTGDHREETMLHFAQTLEDGPLLADALRLVGPWPKSKPVFLAKMDSRDAGVRSAAVFGLGRMKAPELVEPLPKLLADPDARVRASAAFCAGQLRIRADSLLNLAKDAEPDVRKAAFDALAHLPEPRAAPLAVAALNDAATRDSALRCLGRAGGPEHAKAIVDLARQHPSAEVLPLAVSTLLAWSGRANAADRAALQRSIAELQGGSGTLIHWHLRGPTTAAALQPLIAKWRDLADEAADRPHGWQTGIGWGAEARIAPKSSPHDKEHIWLAFSDVVIAEPIAVQFLGASNGPIKIWLNGRPVFERTVSKGLVPDTDRFHATLAKGANRLLIQLGESTHLRRDPEFHLRFRKKSAAANHEQLMQAALAKPGNAERGRTLFLDVNKSQCLKCHRLGDQGEKIGPDLTGVGNRFPRVYLVESILEPNRTIAPSYETLQVQLQDGRVLSGVRIAETPDALTVGDTKGDKHVIARKHIDVVRPLVVSTMPDGLERTLSADDFVDLIAFLVSQK